MDSAETTGGAGGRPVALVSMPWQALDAPSLQVGLLQAVLEAAGVPCRAHSLHLGFMQLLEEAHGDEREPFGVADYREIADRWAELAVGDWIFAVEGVRGASTTKDKRYEEQLAARGMPRDLRRKLRRLRERVPAFLERAAAEILDGAPCAVGFTLTFTQTLASVALARELRKRAPDVRIVFGGAACAAPMGQALLEAFPWVDAALSGEAEAVVVELMRTLRADEPVPRLPGLAVREGERVHAPEPEGRRVEMDSLPAPSFDEYFARLEGSALQAQIVPRLPYESARGCWWGEKAHCTFCGLNALDMTFRSKAPGRVVEELRALSARHRVLEITAVDNIIDWRYLDSVIPALAAEGLDLRIFYETKSNLTRTQVRALRDAGVRMIQPGIESLSTPILKRMRKGVTALQNVRLLKWCRGDGVHVLWNLLFGFPGEPPEEYERMAALVPSLFHLAPPRLGPLVIDRFSPYHTAPEEHGITLHGPLPHYRLLYDAGDELLERLAYTFRHRHDDGRDPKSYIGPLQDLLERWQRESAANTGALTWRRGPDFLQIQDARTTSESARYVLEGLEMAVHLAIESGASVAEIRARVSPSLPSSPTETDVRRVLAELLDARLAMEENGRFLSLALPFDGPLAPLIAARDEA